MEPGVDSKTHAPVSVLAFHGRCIGRQLIGKKCLFLDLVAVTPDELNQLRAEKEQKSAEDVVNLEGQAATSSGSSIMLVGDHVRRAEPLKVQSMLAPQQEGEKSAEVTGLVHRPQQVLSVFVALDAEKSLSQEDFDAFTVSQPEGTKGTISRPRIGDVFQIMAVPREPQESEKRKQAVEGAQTAGGGDSLAFETAEDKRTKLNAKRVIQVAQGEASRPGDYAHKWNEPVKGSRPKQEPGKPRRHGNRFSVFAAWCLDKFTLPAATNVVDVAGGGGKLSAAFYRAGPQHQVQCSCTIVDPRNSEYKICNTQQKPTAGVTQNQQGSQDDENGGEESQPQPVLGKKKAKKLARKMEKAVPLDRIRGVEAFFDYDAQKELVLQCDLIVGLHCDGAVNEIIRAACQAQKNFVICACCVFPKQYPRQLLDGTEVVDRPELHTWIVEECRRQGYKGELGKAHMEFDGANEIAFGIAKE